MIKNWFFYFWLKNIRTSFLLIILIIIAWAFSLYSIPKESSPDIKFGIINVSVSYPWVNPIDMDNLVTDEVEKAIENIEWIKKISSTSSIWNSNVSIELETWVNTRDLLTDIKDKVDNLSLPEDANDPRVVEISSNNTLLYEVLLYWETSSFDEFSLLEKANLISEKLEWRYGIASIDVGSSFSGNRWGGNSSGSKWSYEIKVLLSKSKVELLWLSIVDIANKIKAINKDFPIWSYRVWKLNYDFRFAWELSNIDELKNIKISNNGVSEIKLSDIAIFKKEYSWKSIKRLWFYDNPGYIYTSLLFNKNSGSSVFKTSKSSKKALEKLLENDSTFEWLSIAYSSDMGENIKQDYSQLWRTALTTIILVFLTILFFVWFTEGIIASLLIPLAFFITFIVLDTVWLSMNFLTNFSLVLTLWIAIDTVIVIVEGASEKMKLWFTRRSAIMLAIKDFKSPLISWTSTTLVAFLPLIFLPWITWKFLSFIPITVFITLVAALFLSLTISSALFVTLQRPKKFFHKDEKLENSMNKDDLDLLKKNRLSKLEKVEENFTLREKFLFFLWNFYERILLKIFSKLKYKLLLVIVPFLILILSFIFLSPKIGFTLFPGSDEGVINITIKWKTWSSEDYMKPYLQDIDSILKSIPEVDVYYINIISNNISIQLDLLKKEIREKEWLLSASMLETKLEDDLSIFSSKGLEVSILSLKWWPPAWTAVWVKLVANDWKLFDTLKIVSEDFEDFLKQIKWTKNVSSSSTDSPGQFVFKFDKDRLSNVWLIPSDILNELYFYTNWINAWSIKQNSQDNDIKVSFEEFEDFLSPEDISNLIINTRAWKIRVWDFSTFDFKKSVNNISRVDWKIVIEIWSEVKYWIVPTSIQPKLDEFAKNYNYPDWIYFVKSWETAENSDLIISTVKSLFISLFLIFSILVFQFNSFRQPAIVLYSIVLALLWVNIWLFLTGNPYSMPFAIWFIALTWVVVNDAIILIDRINNQIKDKLESSKSDNIDYVEQLIIAWKSRLQPIIVTTLTTIFWVLPLALQDEFWAWLWFTIIFGLFVWSFMTLVVVPILYHFLILRPKIPSTPKVKSTL
jgi:multidrug efflux pump subunit AcrB